jgi:hypothetical protein
MVQVAGSGESIPSERVWTELRVCKRYHWVGVHTTMNVSDYFVVNSPPVVNIRGVGPATGTRNPFPPSEVCQT